MTADDLLRQYFARLVTAGLDDARIRDAFAVVAREDFVGTGPWLIPARGEYIQTPSDDLSFLYQDILIAIDRDRCIHNGGPSLHAGWMSAVRPAAGEIITHIGCGVGYYTAILAELVGEGGAVIGYELEPDLVGKATDNLHNWRAARVEQRSGCDGPLPASDVIYVNAGVTHLPRSWLDALAADGRLICPLTAETGRGVTLLITLRSSGFEARFISPVAFIPCVGANDPEEGKRLGTAFVAGGFLNVRSFRLGDDPPDDTCWFDGDGWWLSTAVLP